MNKAQQVTSGIKHWGLSGYSSILPRIKFGVTGQISSQQSPTISYRRPLSTILKTTTNINPNIISKATAIAAPISDNTPIPN